MLNKKYVAQYVQKDKDDVILMTEDNINEILDFCREEIEQNTLEQGEDVCDGGYASEFIKNLLVSLRKRLEKSEKSPEKLDKIDKYIEYFGISDVIGLGRKDRKLGAYGYGNKTDMSCVFYYEGEWNFYIARDCWGMEGSGLGSYDFDELRRLDENRRTSSDDEPITVDDYLNERMADREENNRIPDSKCGLLNSLKTIWRECEKDKIQRFKEMMERTIQYWKEQR